MLWRSQEWMPVVLVAKRFVLSFPQRHPAISSSCEFLQENLAEFSEKSCTRFFTEKSVHRDTRSASIAPATEEPQPVDPWLQVPRSFCVATPFLPHVGLHGRPGVATVLGAHCGSTEDFCARQSPPLGRPLPAHGTDFTCRPGARSVSCSFAGSS